MKKCRVRRGKRGITVRSVHGRDNVIAPCEYGFYEDDDSIHLLSSSSPSCRLLAGRDHYSAQRFLKAERKSIGTSWSRDFHRLLSFARFHERSISLTLIVVRLRERPLFLSLSLSFSTWRGSIRVHARLENKITRSTIFPFYLSSGIALLGEFIRRGFDHFYVRFFSSFFFHNLHVTCRYYVGSGKKIGKEEGRGRGKEGVSTDPLDGRGSSLN